MNTNFKKRKKKKQKLVADCGQERVFQLSNDMSEGIRSGTIGEWRAVALYFRNECDKSHRQANKVRMSLAALSISEKMRAAAMREIEDFLES